MDPTYTQFLLAADVTLDTVFHRLAQELGIGKYASAGEKKEPDLVFLIGNESLRRVVIVELKASNVSLEAEHLNQLEFYMQRTEEWLAEKDIGGMQVFGHLIGTKPSPQSRAEGAVVLRKRIKEAGPDSAWKVRDFLEVLTDTQAAHQEIIEIHKKVEQQSDEHGNGKGSKGG